MTYNYADEAQLYLETFKCDNLLATLSTRTLNNCMPDVRAWMIKIYIKYQSLKNEIYSI